MVSSESLIKSEITVHMRYLKLMTLLNPLKLDEIDVQELLDETDTFVRNAKVEDLGGKGEYLRNLLQMASDRYQQYFPPKQSIRKIAREFNDFCNDYNVLSEGLNFGWLHSRMDISNMGLPEFLPYHSVIGLGAHAGHAKAEEQFLLSDAFYVLILAEDAFENLYNHKYLAETANVDEKINYIKTYETLSISNQSVATYSRLAVLSFFSFAESFVNSIGYDFYQRNFRNMTDVEINFCCGKKDGRYLSLEKKIENIPSVIREDKTIVIRLSDKQHIEEPFKEFLFKLRDLRDASVHYSPIKEKIWRKPNEWIEIARSTAKICLEVALQFWKACYPNYDLPKYLDKLDYDKCLQKARFRVDLGKELIVSATKND